MRRAGVGAVVLPARNEGPRVGAVVRAVRATLPGIDVLVVENGSGDDTAARAREAGAAVIHSSPGYARALRAGFAEVLGGRPAWVVQMDADGQHPPEALPALVEALGHADLVVGSRFLGEPGYRVPLARRAAIGALSAWASVLAGQRLLDVTSGLRAWRPEALAALVADWPDDVADANLLVRAVRRGLRVCEVAVPMRARPSGTSMHAGPGAAWFAARMAVLAAREAVGKRPAG